jgi:hypothetical protein
MRNKKVKVSKAIYDKKVFHSKEELEYYKQYEKMKLDKNLVSDTHTAVGICEGFLYAKDANEEIEAWQYLIDTGIVWKLKSWFGIQAQSLIQNGVCKNKIIN